MCAFSIYDFIKLYRYFLYFSGVMLSISASNRQFVLEIHHTVMPLCIIHVLFYIKTSLNSNLYTFK